MLYLSGERKIIKYLPPSLFFFLCHRICNVLAVKIKVLNNLIYSDPESVLTVSIYYFLTRFCGDLNSTNLLVVNIILFHFIFLLILFFSALVFHSLSSSNFDYFSVFSNSKWKFCSMAKFSPENCCKFSRKNVCTSVQIWHQIDSLTEQRIL